MAPPRTSSPHISSPTSSLAVTKPCLVQHLLISLLLIIWIPMRRWERLIALLRTRELFKMGDTRKYSQALKTFHCSTTTAPVSLSPRKEWMGPNGECFELKKAMPSTGMNKLYVRLPLFSQPFLRDPNNVCGKLEDVKTRARVETELERKVVVDDEDVHLLIVIKWMEIVADLVLSGRREVEDE